MSPLRSVSAASGWACRLASFALLWVAAPAHADDPHVVSTPALTADAQRAMFHLPPGFEIQLVASEPEIQKPLNMKFDAAGRLWVADTIEYPYAVKPGQKGRDTVKVLTIDPATGRATKVETFADDLSIPTGVCPTPGGAIVFSIPNIWFLADKDGDGKCDERKVLVGPFDQRDTHGLNNSLTRWIDGRVYACHGFSNNSKATGTDGAVLAMQSGNTYRFRTDGSKPEHHTHGQVNPYGLAFDPRGGLYSADCHSQPAYQLLRGAYYPSFGKPHDGLGYGPTLITHSHGSTGIAGIVWYAATQFPAEYFGTIFIGNPITHKVNHDRLTAHGSTYQGHETPDFLTCDDLWHRPVDLQLGPDGAIYIADFYNCIIGHYEVRLDHPLRDRHRGRIWRIVWKGNGDKPAPATTLPDLTKLSAEELVAKLADDNLTVRTLATHELVDRVGPTAQAIAGETLLNRHLRAEQRAHALWVVERLGGLSAERIAALASDPEPLVKVHLAAALAEREVWDEATTEAARKLARDADPYVRRNAADALGRHPDPANASILAAIWKEAPQGDSLLVHTARMALRNQLLAPGAYAAVAKSIEENPTLRPLVANVSLGAPTAESAEFLMAFMHDQLQETPSLEESMYHAGRYAAEDKLPDLVKTAARFETAPWDRQIPVLEGLKRGLGDRGKPFPEELKRWAIDLEKKLLTSEDEGIARRGLELTRQLKLGDAFEQVAALARPGARFGGLRQLAIDVCATTSGERSIPVLCEVCGAEDDAFALRQKAAQALAGVNTDQAHEELVGLLKRAPEAIAIEIAAGLSISRGGAEKLLAAVTEGKASPRLLLEQQVAGRLRTSGVPELDQRVKKLTEGLPPADDRVKQLLASRREGFRHATPDSNRGRETFKKVCAACHKLEGTGQKIGPELEGIGVRGLDRVLEDVLNPSRNVDQAFRTTIVETADGRAIAGLLLREEGEVLVLADNQGKEVRVPAAEVDSRTASPLSPMPANIAEQIPEAEFYDLVKYLLDQQQTKVPNPTP